MLSFITPVFNAEPYLPQCLESIRSQSVRDWEWIFVDDGSADGSLALLEEAAAADSRIKVLKENRQGPAAARNKALDMVRGEYVAFLDADDWLQEDALSVMQGIVKEHHPDMILWNYLRFKDGDYEEAGNPMPPEGFHDEASTKRFIPEFIFTKSARRRQFAPYLWIRAIRRDVIEQNKLRFDERLKRSEDILFSIELQTCIKSMYVLRAPALTVFRSSEGDISHTYIPHYIDMAKVICDRIRMLKTGPLQRDVDQRVNYLMVSRTLSACKQEAIHKKLLIQAVSEIKGIIQMPAVRDAVMKIAPDGEWLFGKRYTMLANGQALALALMFRDRK
ncbi:MAG: glycosyltransferase family 2 protein [Clostridiales bacterium]|nr:glycosyltransferase family 2 protein [Clostridiales bacterium]